LKENFDRFNFFHNFKEKEMNFRRVVVALAALALFVSLASAQGLPTSQNLTCSVSAATNAPIRTFTPYEIAGNAHLLAAYTCTPLVKIPVSDLKPGAKVKGTTVAELGNGNTPLDMVVYNKGGKDYLLMINTSRGVMKIDLEKVGTIVRRHIASHPVDTIYLVGGTVAFPGMAAVIEEITGVRTLIPGQPLFVTPLGIAMQNS
jgi:hypothetical protein